MTRLSDDDMLRMLREALPPPAGTAPSADLWPGVRGRVGHGSPPPTATDWILIALVAGACLLQPGAALVPLFHF